MESVKKDAQQEKKGLESKAICHFTSCMDVAILKSLGYLFFNYSIHMNMLCFEKKPRNWTSNLETASDRMNANIKQVSPIATCIDQSWKMCNHLI